MAQRSLHAFTKVNPDRLSCFAIGFPLLGITLYPQAPFAIAKVSPCCVSLCTLRPPLAPCGLVGIAIPVSHFRQGKLTRDFLISQQAIPYRTRGGTCCPRVSTPKTRSLADSSMTSHISWRNPTVSTISNLAQTTTSILTRVKSHLDGWKTKHSHKDTSQTQHHIRWKDLYDTHDCRAK
jgi:hypothetical protein